MQYIYVDTGAAPGGDGTESTPYQTLKEARTALAAIAASPGIADDYTIKVAASTGAIDTDGDMNFNFDLATHSLTIDGLTSEGERGAYYLNSYTHFRGVLEMNCTNGTMTLRGFRARSTTANGGTIKCSTVASLNVLDRMLFHARQRCIDASSGGFTIINCVISACGEHGVTKSANDGIIRVFSSTVTRCGGTGLNVGGSSSSRRAELKNVYVGECGTNITNVGNVTYLACAISDTGITDTEVAQSVAHSTANFVDPYDETGDPYLRSEERR